MFTPSIAKKSQQDQAEFFKGLTDLAKVQAVTYASATQTLATIPANSIITRVKAVRLTKWNSAPTTFQIGKTGDADWLMTTAEANMSADIPAGEDAGVEVKEVNKAVTAATDIILTLNQGAASAGSGYVVVEYQELVR